MLENKFSKVNKDRKIHISDVEQSKDSKKEKSKKHIKIEIEKEKK